MVYLPKPILRLKLRSVAVVVEEKKDGKVKARVKVQKKASVGEVIEIKTLISHPMHSGRAVDADGKTIPRNIIKVSRQI